MKTLIFSAMTVTALLLVGWQHKQLGRLRVENVSLSQSSAEAERLKADLAKTIGDGAQDAKEIDRLREENRDLLKLRNEVNQLRETRGQFEKVSAENLRLQALAKDRPKPDAKQPSMQPVVLRLDSVYNRGLNTPEDAIQTYYWGLREGNAETLSRCVVPQLWSQNQDYFASRKPQVDGIVSIAIVARRDIDPTTVQLGIQVHRDGDAQWDRKIIFVLVLQGGEWKIASGL